MMTRAHKTIPQANPTQRASEVTMGSVNYQRTNIVSQGQSGFSPPNRTYEIDQRPGTRNLERLSPTLVHVQSVYEMMLARLLFQPRTTFLEDDVSTGLGEEEDAEDPADETGDELDPVDPLPRDLLGDPVGAERAGGAAASRIKRGFGRRFSSGTRIRMA